MSQTEAAPATGPAIPKDPLVHKSYSFPIAVAMLAVVGATVLAIVDEMWWRRPYKAIQGQYQETYSAYLEKVAAKRADFYVNVLTKLDEFKSLDAAVAAASAATTDAAESAKAKLATATDRSRKLGEALKEAKSEIAALTYESEHKAQASGHDDVETAPAAKPVIDEIAEIRARDVTYTWTTTTWEGGAAAKKEESETGKVGELLVKALDLEAQKAKYQQELGVAGAAVGKAAKAREDWLEENLGNLKYALQNADDETKKQIAESGASRWLDESAVVLRPGAIEGLRTEVDKIPHSWNPFRDGAGQFFSHVSDVPLFRGDIQQIHIKEAANWVDRCTTCHLNVRAPLPVTVEGMRHVLSQTVTIPGATPDDSPTTLEAWPKDKIDSMPLELFKSHPNPELLATHDPERFGCSMCHNGNGVAVTTPTLAHGTNHDWLMPLFPKENAQAGCVQCHQTDLVLGMGDRINAGRDRFRRAGCWGCHKYEGFNTEPDRITALTLRRREIEGTIGAANQRIENLRVLRGAMGDDEAALSRDAAPNENERIALQQDVASLETEIARVDRGLHDAFVERQRVGPNLKDLKIKIRPEFLTDWIRNPREAHKDAAGVPFRADTKMPTFRWWDNPDEEVKDVAAFLWQSAIDYPTEFPASKLPAFTPGNAANGEKLFKETGCLGCHSIGSGADAVGNDYAANLSNLGEKNTPEYVARWINHPRERLVGYDPGREPGHRDVAASKDDPHVAWTQHTIMPNFRLNDQEARDVTTYLTSQKRPGVKYDAAPWLTETKRFDNGRKLVLFQGCAGCHEIRGLEDEKGIGVELTPEGSKPIERLDFGHLTISAERGVEPFKAEPAGLLEDAASLFQKDEPWYRVRGFVLHKIAKPDVYDTAKYLPDRYSRLRMPQFKFSAQEITDVATMVIGSVETQIPETFRYRPDATGQAIRDGWWVVKKYNCQACHQIESTDMPSLWKVPFFAEKVEKKTQDGFLPPSLVGVGYRLRPEWMAKFLRDPSLGGDRANPKSTRPHLPVRMPTFDFSDDEIQKLVLFFEAMASQPFVYQPPAQKPLSAAEVTAASALWKSANCMQCHVINGMPATSETKAPNLSYVPDRLRPEWMRRWISNPPAMNPRTAMTKFFGDHPGPDRKWHFMTALPELQGVNEDHVDLMVRYLLEGRAGK